MKCQKFAYVFVVLTFLVSVIVFLWRRFEVIRLLFFYALDEVVELNTLSKPLAFRVCILALVLLAWSLIVLFKSEVKYKSFAKLVVFGYFSVFFISMYFLTSNIGFRHVDKGPLKWYALTPEGPKYYDTPGIDPVYGIKLKPVTPEVVRQLKLVGKGDFKQVDPEKVSLFNPITGEPQVWYYQSGVNAYEFYDKPGYHPMSGEPLLPVTKEIYISWLRSRDVNKSSINGYHLDSILVSHRKAYLHNLKKGQYVYNCPDAVEVYEHFVVSFWLDSKEDSNELLKDYKEYISLSRNIGNSLVDLNDVKYAPKMRVTLSGNASVFDITPAEGCDYDGVKYINPGSRVKWVWDVRAKDIGNNIPLHLDVKCVFSDRLGSSEEELIMRDKYMNVKVTAPFIFSLYWDELSLGLTALGTLIMYFMRRKKDDDDKYEFDR